MNKKILLIEDMKGIRESLEMILSIAGYQLDFAADGAEGLRKARAGHFDLIVTDILMPEVDGTEVIMALRADGNRVPILAISGGGAGVSAGAALMVAKEKADAVLAKPFSKTELLEAIRALIA
ncbi:MAG: response regulator [Azospirillum sp.]|jgi:DNA-binding response OmpR family regulator|nr:response regulator [Azospirillum sp.]MCA3267483.1 response regulator [Azospirillum sp.]MCZ8123981.1 response regulator [Magnetospirillum sp.]